MRALLEDLRGFEAPRDFAQSIPAPRLAHDALNGGLLDRVQVNGLLVHRDAGLRGANLRWADLRRCDLEGADLRRADLTGARLGGARMTGARLEGARLFKVDVAGAVGLDVTGAEVHPFFEVAEDEEIGDIKMLDLDEPGRGAKGTPRHLVSAPDGTLFWLEDEHPDILGMTVTGGRLGIPPVHDTRAFALIKDSNNKLWCFGNQMFGLFDLNQISATTTGDPVDFEFNKSTIPSSPNQMTPGANGDVWVSLSDRVLQLTARKGVDGFDLNVIKYQNERISARSRVMPSRDGQWLYFIAPDQSTVHVYSYKERGVTTLAFPRGSRPERIIMGSDHRMWFTQSGIDGIGVIDMVKGESEVHPLRLKKGLQADLRGLALGPDGCMWFAERLNDLIGRINGKGEITWFQLPPGTRPLELVSSHDGRMLFTLEGRNAIGSIRAELRPATRFGQGAPDRLGAEAMVEGKPAEGPARPARYSTVKEDLPAAPRPRPEGKKPTGEERREAHGRRIERSEQRFLARQAAVAEATGAGQESPAPGIPRVEGKESKLEAPVALSPVERLGALDVLLAPGVTRHILDQHGAHGPTEKSRFHEDFQTRGSLEALIARGLENADALGRIRRPSESGPGRMAVARNFRILDPEGRYLTYCKAGRIIGEASGAPTRSFVVVKLRVQDEDGQRLFDVVTAHPVPDRGTGGGSDP